MAGHPIRINVSAGSEIDGIQIEHPIIEEFWPQLTDAELVAGVRMWIRNMLIAQYVTTLTENAEQEAPGFINGNTSDIS